MFSTWRVDANAENERFLQQPVDPMTAKPVVQQACNSCRAKKASR
jgi:hypothetical protein